MFVIIFIVLLVIAGYYKTRNGSWPIKDVICTCYRQNQPLTKSKTPYQPHVSPRQLEEVEEEDEETIDEDDNEESKQSEESGDPLECRYLGNVSESSSEPDGEDPEEEMLDDEDDMEERGEDKGGAEEVFVEVEKVEGALEDVEVLRVRHKSAGRSQSWRSVKITASVMNYRNKPGQRVRVR